MIKSYLKCGRDRTREIVRQMYKHICQSCKRKWEESERRFDCHHKGETCGAMSRGYDKIESKRELRKKFTLLCHSCHLRQESVIKKMGVKVRDYKKRIARNNEIMKLNEKMPREEIAKKFEISEQMIYLIINRRSGWKDTYIGGNEKWKSLA